MKSDQSDIDSEIAEVRYQIRTMMQHLSEEGEMLTDLRDQITSCISDKDNDAHFNKCIDIFEMSKNLTRDTARRIGELQELLAEYQKLIELKRKQALDDTARRPPRTKK
ncbi:MAG TPA: hypothetical protein VK436_01865 [Methanocella sp.]|nr:hypothetical protein [Methanocella sp.]